MTTSIRLRLLEYYSSERDKNQGLFLPGKFQNGVHFPGDCLMVFPAVGLQAAGAVFDSLFGITEIAAAVFAQAVQWAVAEQAAEPLRVSAFVAGEIFAGFVLKEIIVRHFLHSALFNQLDTWYNAFNRHSRDMRSQDPW